MGGWASLWLQGQGGCLESGLPASQHANLDAAAVDHLPGVGLKGLRGVLMVEGNGLLLQAGGAGALSHETT